MCVSAFVAKALAAADSTIYVSACAVGSAIYVCAVLLGKHYICLEVKRDIRRAR
jgi:hypothetical protein